MNETKFTPGPWKAGVDELGAPYVEAGNGKILYMDSKTGVEDYANAALVAAAPAMYKLLDSLAGFHWLNQTHFIKDYDRRGNTRVIPAGTPTVADVIRGVLSKARGEEAEK